MHDALEVSAHCTAQIFDFLRLNLAAFGSVTISTSVVPIERAAFVGIDEDHAAVIVLQYEPVLTIVQTRHDDVAALNESQALAAYLVAHEPEDVIRPRPGRVYEHSSNDLAFTDPGANACSPVA